MWGESTGGDNQHHYIVSLQHYNVFDSDYTILLHVTSKTLDKKPPKKSLSPKEVCYLKPI